MRNLYCLNGEKEVRFTVADGNGGEGQDHEKNLDQQNQEHANREVAQPGRPRKWPVG